MLNLRRNLVLADWYRSVVNLNLSLMLAFADIKQRYRRTVLGPIWLTFSFSFTLLGMGLLFGTVFKQNLKEYFYYLMAGYVFWVFILSAISESCYTYIESTPLIRQLEIPYSTYIARVFFRNIIILLHNILLVVLAFWIIDKPVQVPTLEVVVRFLLSIYCLYQLCAIVANLAGRFRDLSQIINQGLQLLFYLTPIIWNVEQVSNTSILSKLVNFNPMFYIIQGLRSILDNSIMSDIDLIILITMSLVFTMVNYETFKKFYKEIAFYV